VVFPGGSARKNCQPAHLGRRPSKLASATTASGRIENGDASGIGQQGKNPADDTQTNTCWAVLVSIHCKIAQITPRR
jgi:hypothetical protein